MTMFELFKKSRVAAIYHRVPISMLELFRSEMAKQGKFYRIRYRGPRFNRASSKFRTDLNMQSTCLKIDATHFSVYRY